ncbi:MAG TPA: hypothetical protein VK489_02000 [Ferruginibacter sp.]|nr:hypothetical protein [Ferruginibacter sp.]
MKFLFSLVMLLSGSCYLHAQKPGLAKRVAISSLNAKAKEAMGNIRFFKTGKKLTITDASVSATEMGVKIGIELAEPGKSNTTWTYEFNPAEIMYIYNVDMPDESPVGQIRISLSNKIGYRSSYYKSEGLMETYEEDVYLSYLKVDKDNFLQIQSALFKLKEMYIDEANEPLKPLANAMSRSKDFWISAEGASNTYELSKVYVTGCTMRFIYYLQSIGTSGDKKQMYLTIIPLSEIDDVRLDKNKSRPNCIMLESGKKGFETFELKDKKYVATKAVKEMPLFIDVTYDRRRDEIMEILKTQVKECGGGKIKL